MFFFYFVVGFLVCPHQLGAEGATDLWKLALQDGYVLSLFRDEYLLIHSVFEKFLQELKTKELVTNIWILVIINQRETFYIINV